MVSDSNSHFDIVIAGGGMTGSCLALALAPLGLQIAVVEAVARGDPIQPSFDDRSTALSRSSQRMFAAIGLWPEIAAASVPIASIHVSDRGNFGFSHFDAAEQQVEALGYVVVNRVLGEVLQKALSGLQGLDFLCPARIVEARQEDDHVRLIADASGASRELTCSLLVGADGAKSTVRHLLGIRSSHIDYGQSAVTGNVLPEIPPANRAWERFTEGGPLALLPLTEGRAAFIWTLPSAEADSVMQLSEGAFLDRLQQAFGLRLGAFAKAGRRSSYPLALTRAARLTARRSVLIGNAANCLHPVAAQGFNLGLRDVAALCDCIAGVLSSNRAGIGEDGMLRAYIDWRRADHRQVAYLTNGLVRLFGSKLAPVRALRALGMLGLDLVPGARLLFARQTMGLAGRLPALSRGVPLKLP